MYQISKWRVLVFFLVSTPKCHPWLSHAPPFFTIILERHRDMKKEESHLFFFRCRTSGSGYCPCSPEPGDKSQNNRTDGDHLDGGKKARSGAGKKRHFIGVWILLLRFAEDLQHSEISFFVFYVFVYFRVSLRVHGPACRLVFTKSLQSLAGQSCDWEIGKFS